MIVRTDSLIVRVLLLLANPTMRLPRVFPLYVRVVRVGQDTTTFCRVTFRP
jgi:hypothetical protein